MSVLVQLLVGIFVLYLVFMAVGFVVALLASILEYLFRDR